MALARPALRELGASYEEVRGRIFELIRDLDDPASVAVPACPTWSVHDLAAHLTGNCVDVLRGNIEGVASDEWTAAQVEERRGRPTAAVLAEWAEVAPAYAAMIDDFPGRYRDMPVADIAVHEQDLRGALDRPGERGSEAVAIAMDFLITVIVHSAAVAFGLGPLELRMELRSWTVGTGEPATGDPDAWKEALLSEDRPGVATPAVASVSPDTFELFRAVSGRRSANQIRSFEWSVDPEPYLVIFGYGPFTIRSSDLDE